MFWSKGESIEEGGEGGGGKGGGVELVSNEKGKINIMDIDWQTTTRFVKLIIIKIELSFFCQWISIVISQI